MFLLWKVVFSCVANVTVGKCNQLNINREFEVTIEEQSYGNFSAKKHT